MQICASAQVRGRYGDGIWVTIGERTAGAALAEKISAVAYQLSGETIDLADPEQAGLRLGVLLDQCGSVLLVLDDVWAEQQLRPFLHGGAGTCTRLVTTRRPAILPSAVLDRSVQVDQLTPAQARALLVGGLAPLDQRDLTELVQLTGRWPLLAQLTHRRLADELRGGLAPAEAVARVAEQLRIDGPDSLDIDDEASRDRAVSANIAASMERLGAADQARYLELGIFAEDLDIPRDMLALLWGATGGLSLSQVDKLSRRLADFGLVADYRSTTRSVRLHDVIRAYLRHRGSDQLAATNAALVRAARSLLPAQSAAPMFSPWWQLPDHADYLWRHLYRHLADAGHADELATLVCDLRWVEARTVRDGPIAAIIDLSGSLDPTTAVLRRTLQRSAHLLTPIKPRQALADTLASRLHNIAELEPILSAYTATMADQVRLVPRWPLPDQPHPAQRQVLVGHTHPVEACAITPDGTWLVTGSRDRTARIWDVATGVVRHVLTGHGDWVTGCAVAPDGTWLVTTSHDRTARIWDAATGVLRCALTDHTDWVTGCAVAPDGTWLATTSRDRTVRIWDVATGVLRHTLTGHTAPMTGCAVAPDGTWLVTTSGDQTHGSGMWRLERCGTPSPVTATG